MRVLLAFFLLTTALWSAEATDRDHWAFRALAPDVPPAVAGRDARTPVDAFILRELRDEGLSLSPPAERSRLLRRLSFDLTGLPPSPGDVADFLADRSSGAYERVVDRLLSSPQFGERWGRHWLDYAGYSDIVGGDNDAGIIKLAVGKWRYRDYVIASLNADKPFAEFVTEQVAGDELVDWRAATKYPPRTLELLTATTFLRATADDTAENELNTPDIRHGVLQRTVELVGGNLLALTFECAKCHDHKYDPISQEDYYRFVAVFAPAFNPTDWKQPKDRDIPTVAKPEKAVIDRHNEELDAREKALDAEVSSIHASARAEVFDAKLADVLATASGESEQSIRTAFETVEKERNEEQQRLVAAYEERLTVHDAERDDALTESQKARLAEVVVEKGELKGQRLRVDVLHAVYDVGPPGATHLLERGNHLTPGKEVEPGFPRVLSDDAVETAVLSEVAVSTTVSTGEEPLGATSGRRLSLARWLTTPGTRGHALATRVFVNRVWQRLFGRGIVASSGNFGRAGTAPTHPELLEWLAAEFERGGGSLKRLVRLLVTSNVYRQSSRSGPAASDAQSVDPENRLLWRARLRRLESEVIRDAVLAASGLLERRLGGPAVPLKVHSDGRVSLADELAASSDRWRRSVYVLARRNYHLSLLATFDQPVVNSGCAERSPSAVVTQSLTMLNDDFIVEHARAMARRILHGLDEGAPDAAAIESAFLLLLGRAPAANERSWCGEFVARHLQRFGTTGPKARLDAFSELCHTLLNTSEFLYVP